MAIDWQPILEKGAEKLGESLGTALGNAIGGPVGAALAQAILGGGDANEDLAKIDERLSKIEAKIDTLTRYLVDELPAITYNQSLLANLAVEQGKFTPLRNAVMADLAKFRADPTNANFAESLSQSMSALLVQGNYLVTQGPPYFPFAVMSLTLATTVYNQLVALNAAFARALEVWSQAFLDATQEWIKPELRGGVAFQRAELSSALGWAQHVTTQFPNGVPHALVVVDGPRTGAFDGQPLPGYYYNTITAYLDRMNGENFTGGQVLPRQVHLDYQVANDRLAEIAAKVYLGDGVPPLVLDWFPPLRQMPQGWGLDDTRQALADKYNLARRQVASLPGRVNVSDDLLKEIGILRSVAASYAKPNAFQSAAINGIQLHTSMFTLSQQA